MVGVIAANSPWRSRNQTLKHYEYSLKTPQSLTFQGQVVGTIERTDFRDRTNGLRIRSVEGAQIDLPSAVDLSEQLDEPRIFVSEGLDPNQFFLFGGEIAFWVTSDVTQVSRFDLFRQTGLEEYWTTTILEQPQSLIFIYESGVLMIDESLHVVMHREKLINDFFVAIEGDALRFSRDHGDSWLMPLDSALHSGS